ncbi:hypothetical protein LTR78_010531 [Recurvomyces mirabilis]|uniref:Uncharacterized protein n=1 Tax=Recurvomyces mirabilis TaxID=574656 RepID=A0AAE0WI77_9PEZI|nr:hypothetical protein LTR78_010531 [Recurvomyces mirabilis]KAK5149601.1 hypothetical protein LTS14_010803 [Recurvomyces mirabilis]
MADIIADTINDTAAQQLMNTFLFPKTPEIHNPAPTRLQFYHNDYLIADLTSALELTACA